MNEENEISRQVCIVGLCLKKVRLRKVIIGLAANKQSVGILKGMRASGIGSLESKFFD